MSCNTCRLSGDPLEHAASLLKCANVPLRVIDKSDVLAYAHRANVNGNDELCSVSAALLSGRIIYWKNVPGDCPTKSKISLGPQASISKYGSLGLTGLGAASSVSLLATGGAGVGASAGGAGVALGGLPSIIGAVAGPVALALIPLAVWSVISAHHKIAVAREQATICDFAQAYNTWEDTIEQGIVSQACSVADAKAAVPQVEQTMMAGLQAIYKKCNAACIMQKSLRALDLYAVEKLYDSLGTRSAGYQASVPGGLPGASKSSTGGKYGIAALAGAGAALLA